MQIVHFLHCEKYFLIRLLTHSVEISLIFCITQILREINFKDFRSAKPAILCNIYFRARKFQPSKSAKIHENDDSEIRNVLK